MLGAGLCNCFGYP